MELISLVDVFDNSVNSFLNISQSFESESRYIDNRFYLFVDSYKLYEESGVIELNLHRKANISSPSRPNLIPTPDNLVQDIRESYVKVNFTYDCLVNNLEKIKSYRDEIIKLNSNFDDSRFINCSNLLDNYYRERSFSGIK
jgi:hypothetical protein